MLRLLMLLVLIATVAACGSTRKKELKPVELESFKAELAIKTLWSRGIGGLGKYYHQFAMAVDGAYLYAASAEGKVFKLDKLKGKRQWKVSLDTELTTGVAVGRQHVYVASLDGVVIALDKNTGEQVWIQQVDSEVVSPPAVNGDHVVFQTSSGDIYNLNTADGALRWRKPSNLPALSLRGNSHPVFFANFVIVGLANGRLSMMDLNTGETRWEPRIAIAKGDSEIERMIDVDGTPLVLEDKLYAASYQGQLAAFSLSQGQPLWSVDESTYRDLAAGLGNVYISSADAQLTAYDQRTGDVKWSQNGLLRRKTTAPAVFSSYVVVADYKGYIHLVSQIDGRFIARKRLNGKGIKTNILVDGDRFYVLANNGRLKAYQLGKSLK